MDNLTKHQKQILKHAEHINVLQRQYIGTYLLVWADGTTRNQDEELPTNMSDDYIVFDCMTPISDLEAWVGKEVAAGIIQEYLHGE